MRENRLPFRKPIPALNIKDPEAHRLAAAIAQETGETLARVVTEALRERFERLPSSLCKASVEELRAIAQRASGLVKEGHLDHAEFLYECAKSSTDRCAEFGPDIRELGC
jgi:antitoxin VapB